MNGTDDVDTELSKKNFDLIHLNLSTYQPLVKKNTEEVSQYFPAISLNELLS